MGGAWLSLAAAYFRNVPVKRPSRSRGLADTEHTTAIYIYGKPESQDHKLNTWYSEPTKHAGATSLQPDPILLLRFHGCNKYHRELVSD